MRTQRGKTKVLRDEILAPNCTDDKKSKSGASVTLLPQCCSGRCMTYSQQVGVQTRVFTPEDMLHLNEAHWVAILGRF